MSVYTRNKINSVSVSLLIIFFIIILLPNSLNCSFFNPEPTLTLFEAVPDNKGGAIVAWQIQTKVMAQRLSFVNGELIYSSPVLLGDNSPLGESIPKNRKQFVPIGLVSDSNNGAYISWVGSEINSAEDNPAVKRTVLVRLGENGEATTITDGHDLESLKPVGKPVIKIYNNAIYLFIGGFLAKFSPDNKIQWQKQLLHIANYDVDMDGAGNLLVTWSITDNKGNKKVYISKYTNSGYESWSHSYLAPYYYKTVRVTSNYLGVFVRSNSTECGLISNNGKIMQHFEAAWNPQGSLENMLITARPDGEIMLVTYGVNKESRSYYYSDDGASSIILKGFTVDGNYWVKELVNTREGGRAEPVCIYDNAGYLIAWREWYKRSDLNGKIYIQAVNTDGSLRWNEPVAVFPDKSFKHQRYPVLMSDGADGAVIIANTGPRSNLANEIRAQHISPEGHRLWGDKGILITKR